MALQWKMQNACGAKNSESRIRKRYPHQHSVYIMSKQKHTAVGIDVGTHTIKVVVAEHRENEERPVVLGTGFARSKGLRHGYVVNARDMERSLQAAITQAEKTSGTRIERAYLSIGGIGLDEVHMHAEVMVARADSVITDLDIKALTEECERRAGVRLQNRKVLHSIPIEYRIDGQKVLGRPQGMKGVKIAVHMLFITTIEQHLDDLIAAIEETNLSVIDVMASPLAGSFVTLTKAQKIAGCILVNLGAETMSLVVFENNIPISLKVFPIGSADITNDIALGLKISLDDAEELKRGSYLGASVPPRKKVEEIIGARLNEMFTLVEAHLTKLGKNGLLPAGIIISGGGSGIATIEDIAAAVLRLPSKKASLLTGTKGISVKDSSWAVSYGLCIWGLSVDDEATGIAIAKQAGTSLISWITRFLP